MHESTPATGSYVIGIDLGTTNCSLAFARKDAPSAEVQLLKIPQWDGEGRLFPDVKLPSFTWLLPKSMQKSGARRLSWNEPDEQIKWVVGREAKAESLKDHSRVIHSAKSWLSVGAGSTRQSSFLPWGSAGVGADEKLSPIMVQSAYLQHLKAAWDSSFDQGLKPEPFSAQNIVITVPASFDELAQRLTIQAAEQAGYPGSISLLEEPLAAFYDYWQPEKNSGSQWSAEGYRILICDVGGGTSDFSLLAVYPGSSQPHIERIKISEHILLGGDNIDLRLAHLLAEAMGPEPLPRHSWALLLAQVRKLKEDILSAEGPPEEEFFVSVPRSSHQLLGAYASASITRKTLLETIVQGFFPAVDAAAKPEQEKTKGLRDWGLPFAEDSAITRHLAAFLAGQTLDAVLFAGGTLLPRALQEHILLVLRSWQPNHPVEHLQHGDPDLAIARGAARFASLKSSSSTLVESPYPQSLYVALQHETEEKLLCLIPRGWPRQKAARLYVSGLNLRLGSEVAFQLYASRTAEKDQIGQLAFLDKQTRPLPLLTTILDKGQGHTREIPVSLEAIVQETGLLELRCLADDGTGRQWLLDFALETDQRVSEAASTSAALATAPRCSEAENMLRNHFSKNGVPPAILSLPKLLEDILGPRQEWNLPTLRQLWPAVEDAMFRRQKNQDGEAVWLYMAGFLLRPGFGASRDSERLQSLWRVYDQGFSKGPAEKTLEAAFCLLWRRVAGGLNRTQQNRILDRILPAIRKEGEAGPEMIRLAASLERVDGHRRIQLGRTLVQQITSGSKDQLDSRIWALARIASRYPLYAGPEAVLPIAIIEEWAESLKSLPVRSKAYQKLSLFYNWAGRCPSDVYTGLDQTWLQHFVLRLQEAGVPEEEWQAVASQKPQDQQFMGQLFGEALPLGLMLKGLPSHP